MEVLKVKEKHSALSFKSLESLASKITTFSQGLLGGPLVSQAVLDEGVMEHFPPGGAY